MFGCLDCVLFKAKVFLLVVPWTLPPSKTMSCLARAETLNGPKVFSFQPLPRTKQLGRKKRVYFSHLGHEDRDDIEDRINDI